MTRLGKYELEALLGSGATADVYRAEDTVLGRKVALKVLKPALIADESAFTRFAREAQAAAGLFHDHIATVLDMGEAGGRFFIAIRLVDGESLDKIIRQGGPLTMKDTLRMAQQIGSALDYAHRQGFLHRDVKPSNILRDRRGEFWLTDFGLTKAMMSTGMTSLTGAVLGTPPYIAPEVWLGEPASPATDQYALACVVFEALTGQVLFAGETPPAVMTNHVLKGPVRLDQLEEVNGGELLRDVLAKALSQKPEERFDSAGRFAAALEDALTEKQPGPNLAKPLESLPVSILEPAQKTRPSIPGVEEMNRASETAGSPLPQAAGSTSWIEPEKQTEHHGKSLLITVGLTLGGLALGLIVVFFIISLVSGQSPMVIATQVPTTTLTSTSEPTLTPTITETVMPTSTLTLQPTQTATETLIPTTTLLGGGLGKIAFDSGRDGNGEIYVMDADGSNPTRLTDNAADDWNPSWSPDGQHIAFVSTRDGNWEIYVMDADGSNPTRLTNSAATDYEPSWSLDGQHIAFASDRDGNLEIYVMDADGSHPTRLTDNAAGDVDPTWSPDGQHIAFTSDRDGNLEIYVMDADGSHPTRLTNSANFDGFPSWSPDGQHIAFTSGRDGNWEIYVMDADGSHPTRLTNNPVFDSAPSWSPDGQYIAFASGPNGSWDIYVMDADGSHQTRLTDGFSTDNPSWAP